MSGFAERYLNRRMILELAPAIVFFAVNYGWGLMAATAAVMVATLATTATGLALDRRIPVLAVTTLILVFALGGASLIFESELFIKIRPTVGNTLFALALSISLGFHGGLLRRAFEGQLHLSDAGWLVLTGCWIALALCLAAANELVWRTLDTDSWVAFKTAETPLSILAYILLTRFVAGRYWQAPA